MLTLFEGVEFFARRQARRLAKRGRVTAKPAYRCLPPQNGISMRRAAASCMIQTPEIANPS